MYPFWPLSGALQLPKWCMLITEMAHPIYRISGALTLPKSGALSITDYNKSVRINCPCLDRLHSFFNTSKKMSHDRMVETDR
jgi:hypothetical protein